MWIMKVVCASGSAMFFCIAGFQWHKYLFRFCNQMELHNSSEFDVGVEDFCDFSVGYVNGFEETTKNETNIEEGVSEEINVGAINPGTYPIFESNEAKTNLFGRDESNGSEANVSKMKKRFKCSVCGAAFRRRAGLTQHEKIHTGEKPFECNFCEWKFTHLQTLKDHLRTHTGEKPFVCSICDAKFARKSNMVTHERSHTGNKSNKSYKYTCHLCNATFTRGHMKNHLMTHTGERPFTCSFCDAKFSRKSNMVAHERTHTGHKPYECKYCEQKFTWKVTLIKHESRNHTAESEVAGRH